MATSTGSIGAFYAGLKPVTKLYIGDSEVWGGVAPVVPSLPLAGQIAALNPVAWLKLDDASGALVNYGSVSDNGTRVGGPLYRADVGPDGASYMRFGSGQYVSLPGNTPGNASRNLTTSKTLAIAFRPTSSAGYNQLMSKGLTGGDREWLVNDSDASGRWLSYIGQDIGASAVYRETALSSNYPATLNTWHFIVVVLDKGNPIRLYIDSPIERPSTKTGPTGTQETGGTDIITIGAWPGLETTFYFSGALAHATIFEGAMSNSDVATLMASATAEGWTPTPPPAGTIELALRTMKFQTTTGAMTGIAPMSVGDLVFTSMISKSGVLRPMQDLQGTWSYFEPTSLPDTEIANLTYQINPSNIGSVVVSRLVSGGVPAQVRGGTGLSMALAAWSGATSIRQTKQVAGVSVGFVPPAISAAFDTAPVNTCVAILHAQTVYDDTGFEFPVVAGWTKVGAKLGDYSYGTIQHYVSTSGATPTFSAPSLGTNLASTGWSLSMFELSNASTAAVPVYRAGAAAAQYWNNSATTRTLDTQAVVGDLILCQVLGSTSAPLYISSPGWKLVREINSGSNSKLYSRRATGTSDDDPVISPIGSAYGGAMSICYSGGCSVIRSASANYTLSPAGVTSGPSVIATANNQIGVSFAVRGNDSTMFWLAPSKGTERYNVSGNWANFQAVEVAGNIGEDVGSVGHNFAFGAIRAHFGVLLG